MTICLFLTLSHALYWRILLRQTPRVYSALAVPTCYRCGFDLAGILTDEPRTRVVCPECGQRQLRCRIPQDRPVVWKARQEPFSPRPLTPAQPLAPKRSGPPAPPPLPAGVVVRVIKDEPVEAGPGARKISAMGEQSTFPRRAVAWATRPVRRWRASRGLRRGPYGWSRLRVVGMLILLLTVTGVMRWAIGLALPDSHPWPTVERVVNFVLIALGGLVVWLSYRRARLRTRPWTYYRLYVPRCARCEFSLGGLLEHDQAQRVVCPECGFRQMRSLPPPDFDEEHERRLLRAWFDRSRRMVVPRPPRVPAASGSPSIPTLSSDDRPR